MAHLNIELREAIHAEILSENDFTSPNTPLILDPITNSYSEFADLVYYNLEITQVKGLLNPSILNNGKNSRFTSNGSGSCIITLYIEDELGNSATDTKKIIVA